MEFAETLLNNLLQSLISLGCLLSVPCRLLKIDGSLGMKYPDLLLIAWSLMSLGVCWLASFLLVTPLVLVLKKK